MLRVYAHDWEAGETLPALDRAERHHLVRVRRVRPGEPVEVLNGRGAVALCEVAAVDNRDLELAVRSIRETPLPALQVHLLVALPKGKTFSLVLHTAVELGVRRITPLVTANAEVDTARAENKLGRWEAILVEALKQSGNPWLPVLDEPTTLETALAGGSGVQRLCGALQADAEPLWDLLQGELEPAGTIQVYIGPEGDFSEGEYARLRGAGCRFASLGPLVLKVETAASLVAGALALWSRR